MPNGVYTTPGNGKIGVSRGGWSRNRADFQAAHTTGDRAGVEKCAVLKVSQLPQGTEFLRRCEKCSTRRAQARYRARYEPVGELTKMETSQTSKWTRWEFRTVFFGIGAAAWFRSKHRTQTRRADQGTTARSINRGGEIAEYYYAEWREVWVCQVQGWQLYSFLIRPGSTGAVANSINAQGEIAETTWSMLIARQLERRTRMDQRSRRDCRYSFLSKLRI